MSFCQGLKTYGGLKLALRELMRFDYPPAVIKTEDKANYFSVLQQADAGLLEPFVDYIAVNVNRSLSLMIAAASSEGIEDDDASAAFEAMRQQLNGRHS